MLHESRDTSVPEAGREPVPARMETRAARLADERSDQLMAQLAASDAGGGELRVRVRDVPGDALVVQVAGEVDLATAPALRDELAGACAGADGRRVVLDLAAVGFLGSAGLRVLAEVNRRCQSQGLEFVVAKPGSSALRAIQLSGLDRVLSIDPSGPRSED